MTALALPPGLVQPGEPFVPPAHLWVPQRVSSAVDEGVDLLASVGRSLDAEQRLVLDTAYAERADGRWGAFELALFACRQNLKSYCFEAMALIDLFLIGDPLIVWTAHLFSTTMEAFRHLKALVEDHRHLAKHVLRIPTGNGDEAIELRNGSRLLFRARSKTGGRGLSGDKVFLDEALFLSGTEVGSLLPTMAARPNPQVRYGSSAGVATSAVARSLRDRGRKGGDPSLAYLEWCAPGSMSSPGCRLDPCPHTVGTDGCVLDDRALWQAANPAMGRRIDPERIAAFRRSMEWAEFAREFLGWWDEPTHAVERAIDAGAWLARRDEASWPTDPVAIAIDVTPRQTAASVALAGWRPRSQDVDAVTEATRVQHAPRQHLEVMATGEGSGWVVDYVVERVLKWDPVTVALDGSSPAASLLPALRAALREADRDPDELLTILSARDLAAASEGLDRGVREDGVRHPGQPEVAAAVEGATWRPLAGARAFARQTSTVNISPLVALAIAGWALVAKRPPEAARVIAEPRSIDRPADTTLTHSWGAQATGTASTFGRAGSTGGSVRNAGF